MSGDIDGAKLLIYIKPYVLGWVSDFGFQLVGISGGSPYAPTPHALYSSHHSGIIEDTQATQFLKTDGSRALTGNLAVSAGITIDGVDISALASAASTSHQLSANSSVGATSVSIAAPGNALDAVGWIVIDAYTVDCEIRKITSISGATVNFATALVYAHATDDAALIVFEPTVYVKWFGAVADGVADDYTAAQRAVNVNFVNSGLPRNLHVVFPPTCRIGTSLNLTDREDVLIEGSTSRSQIIGACAGAAVFDMNGAGYCTVRNLMIFGEAANAPSVGIWSGRTTGNENAGSNTFENVHIKGYFTYGGFYNIVGELARYRNCVVDLYGYLTTTRFTFYTSSANDYALTTTYATLSATVTNYSIFIDNCYFLSGPTVTTNFIGVGIGPVSTVYIKGGYFTSWATSAIKLIGSVAALHIQDLLIEGSTLTNTIWHAAVAGAGTLWSCTIDNCFFNFSSKVWSSDAGTTVKQIEINNIYCVAQSPATWPIYAFATVDTLYMRGWSSPYDQGDITATNMYDSEIWLRSAQTLTISGTRRSVNTRQDSGFQTFDLKAEFLKGVRVTGSEAGFGGGEVRLNGGAGSQNVISTNTTGSPTIEFDHLGTGNTGLWSWKNGTSGATEVMRLDATGLGIAANKFFVQYSDGDITRIKNVVTSWPAAQGAANTLLRNDGSGNLSWLRSLVLAGITLDEAGNIVLGTTTGTKLGTATSQKLGLFNVTPVIQPAGAGQAAAAAQSQTALTDSTGGTVSTTLAAIAAGAAYAQADMLAAKDAIASLAAELALVKTDMTNAKTLEDAIRTALVNLGVMKGAA